MDKKLHIKFATSSDISLILNFINSLAKYEKLQDEVVATEEMLFETLFGEQSYAEVILGYYDMQPVAFALFFHNYSTFLGRPGIYLEDLYVKPEVQGKGIGRKMLAFVAHLAIEKNYGRLEFSVLNWNQSAIEFYKHIAAKPMDEWTTYRLDNQALKNLADSYE